VGQQCGWNAVRGDEEEKEENQTIQTHTTRGRPQKTTVGNARFHVGKRSGGEVFAGTPVCCTARGTTIGNSTKKEDRHHKHSSFGVLCDRFNWLVWFGCFGSATSEMLALWHHQGRNIGTSEHRITW
jgi:hypothetical protein